MSHKQTLFIRNFIFGVEDSLVSTVGLLSGVAIAHTPKPTILLAGMVLIFVESFSMGVGSYLSETSAENFNKRDPDPTHTIYGAVIMFFSYFFAGFIPLAPYIFAEPSTALPISIALSIFALFMLGVMSAKFSDRNIIKEGLKMMIIGGIAIGLGSIVGRILS